MSGDYKGFRLMKHGNKMFAGHRTRVLHRGTDKEMKVVLSFQHSHPSRDISVKFAGLDQHATITRMTAPTTALSRDGFEAFIRSYITSRSDEMLAAEYALAASANEPTSVDSPTTRSYSW